MKSKLTPTLDKLTLLTERIYTGYLHQVNIILSFICFTESELKTNFQNYLLKKTLNLKQLVLLDTGTLTWTKTLHLAWFTFLRVSARWAVFSAKSRSGTGTVSNTWPHAGPTRFGTGCPVRPSAVIAINRRHWNRREIHRIQVHHRCYSFCDSLCTSYTDT